MPDTPVKLTLGCARFMASVLREAIEVMEPSHMKSFYKGRLDEIRSAIKEAEQENNK